MTKYKLDIRNLFKDEIYEPIDTEFANKSFQELFKELAQEINEPKYPTFPEESSQERLIRITNRATLIQMEMTRRLIKELNNSTRSTNRLSMILIALTVILVFLTIVLIALPLLTRLM